MTVLHATEPATVHLAVAARAEGVTSGDVDAALHEERSLVRQLAMRRTMFVLDRDLLPATWASASARVAGQQHARLEKAVAAAGLAGDPAAWLAQGRDAMTAALAGTDGLTQAELRTRLPEFDVTLSMAPGTRWSAPVPLVGQLLTWLSAAGVVLRGRNRTHWRHSRPAYVLPVEWLGEQLPEVDERTGWTTLVHRWLRTLGPGTERDVQWWLGGTLGAVRAAFTEIGAVAVDLDDGSTGWVLPDDTGPVEPVEPWAALLPVLDPTTMGWKERDFYLGPHAPVLVDTAGNAGATAWWDGRIVGGWYSGDDGRIHLVPAEPWSAPARRALQVEADRLQGWLDGERLPALYASLLVRRARGTA